MSAETAMMALDAEGRIISLSEAARRLGISYPTVRRLAVTGELKAFKIRNSWRTSTAALDAFVREQIELQDLARRSVEVEA